MLFQIESKSSSIDVAIGDQVSFHIIFHTYTVLVFRNQKNMVSLNV